MVGSGVTVINRYHAVDNSKQGFSTFIVKAFGREIKATISMDGLMQSADEARADIENTRNKVLKEYRVTLVERVKTFLKDVFISRMGPGRAYKHAKSLQAEKKIESALKGLEEKWESELHKLLKVILERNLLVCPDEENTQALLIPAMREALIRSVEDEIKSLECSGDNSAEEQLANLKKFAELLRLEHQMEVESAPLNLKIRDLRTALLSDDEVDAALNSINRISHPQ